MASTSEDVFAAIEDGDVARVRALLEAAPELAAARDSAGVSALMRARYRSDRALIEAIAMRVGQLDVFEASAGGDLDRLAELLDDDPAATRVVSGDGFTALHFAAFFGRAEAARLLLVRGADVDARGTGWMTGTPLHSAASGRHADVVAVLLEAGADADTRQAGGWTALHGSAHAGDAASVGLLLAAGADPAATNDDGASVRDLAARSGDGTTLRAVEAALGSMER